MKENEDENLIIPILKPYEIYLFNIWIFLRIFIILCVLVILLPEDFVPNLLGLRVFPQKYWFIIIFFRKKISGFFFLFVFFRRKRDLGNKLLVKDQHHC